MGSYPHLRPDLTPLLRPRSVALVGASATPGSFGQALLRQALETGFAGAVYPVNPTRADIDGARCYPSLADLPERVDCAVLAVGDARLEESLRAVAAAGIPAAVIFGAMPVPGDPDPLPARLSAIAREAGLALLGGNCMGFYNAVDRLYVSGFPARERGEAGGIAFVSHSGSSFSALANSGRDFRFSWLISPGQELALTAADYLRFLVRQPETRVVGLFLESVRDPEGFVVALEQAAAADVPVVVLKVGRSEQGQRMALAHSGALAGSDAAFTALCERWGVLRVSSLDEMGDALELLAAPGRVRPGGLALAGDSGGERAMIVDRAAALDVPWATLGAATLGDIATALEPGLQPDNPLDMWGTGKDWQASYERCLTAMASDPAVGATVLAVDLVPGSRLASDYIDVTLRVRAQTGAPLAVLGNMSSTIDREFARRLRAGGVPVLMGTDTGLRALRHALRRAPVAPAQPRNAERAAAWAVCLGRAGGPLDEAAAKRVLAAWGIPTVAECLVDNEHELVLAASALGWPVVLKSAAPGLLHKSDVGAVRLHLENGDQVAAAYADLRERFGPRVVVQQQIDTRESVELFLGVSHDPQFGPLLSVGLGGVWVEALGAVTFALPPVDAALAEQMLVRMPGGKLLAGGRGRPPVDRRAVVQAIVDFSQLAYDLAPYVAEIDVNPLVAGPHGVVAVDALIVPRNAAPAVDVQGGTHA
ncbi:MAG: acetate--CoA ligase family protein [Thermomicrobiales bacterium]|nr:acetate--CoA ligase family protein [Thermomicrobiales bacterium]